MLGFRDFGKALEEADRAGGDDPARRLHEQARAYVRFALENPARFQLMFRHDKQDLTNQEFVEVAHRSYLVLEGAVRAATGTAAGQELSAEAVGFLQATWSIVHGFSPPSARCEKPWTIDQVACRNPTASALNSCPAAVPVAARTAPSSTRYDRCATSTNSWLVRSCLSWRNISWNRAGFSSANRTYARACSCSRRAGSSPPARSASSSALPKSRNPSIETSVSRPRASLK